MEDEVSCKENMANTRLGHSLGIGFQLVNQRVGLHQVLDAGLKQEHQNKFIAGYSKLNAWDMDSMLKYARNLFKTKHVNYVNYIP